MKSTIISKIKNFALGHPRLMIYSLVLAIMLGIGAATGMLEQQQAFAKYILPDCPSFHDCLEY
jgi:hypothetical protein